MSKEYCVDCHDSDFEQHLATLEQQAEHLAATASQEIDRAARICGLRMLNEALKETGYQLVQH